jgi:anti-sigma regulatory factor (Ser/Thr protein kinase)
MSEAHLDQVEFDDSEARFIGNMRQHVQRHFLRFTRKTIQRKPAQIILDFSLCTSAFPNTMVPVIADCARLRRMGIRTHVLLPKDDLVRRHFYRANWAHFLDPTTHEPTDDVSDRHLAVVQYQTSDEQHKVVNNLLEITMRSLQLDRSLLAGLEWAINEITDNVLNHSDSADGGFIQLATMKERVAFCVADCGRGIRASLREAIPNLASDAAAIGHAVRAGVTRNKDVGQGNGLSGTLKIATETGGVFHVQSGLADACWIENGAVENRPLKAGFDGTFIDVQIRIDQKIDLAQVLSKGTNVPTYQPTDFIETQYLSDDARDLRVNLRDDTFGFGTRRAGAQMRTKCLNLMDAEPGARIVLDWDGVQMISSSYADEFVAKLYWQLGPTAFAARVRHDNSTNIIRQLIDKAILQRVQQMMSGLPGDTDE